MAKSGEFVKDTRVIGYVRVENRDDLYITDQNSRLEGWANREAIDVVQIEHEVSNGQQLMRTGVWKVLRMVACSNCEPKPMPMIMDYDFWFKEVMKPCSCKAPLPSHGLLIDDIKILAANPPQGAKFILDMCMHKKHLYSVREKRCLSCCNPQAIAFLKRQTLGG